VKQKIQSGASVSGIDPGAPALPAEKAPDVITYSADQLAAADVIVVGIDRTGRVQSLNATAARATGYSSEEIAGKNWFELLTPRLLFPQAWADFTREASSTNDAADIECPVITKSGDQRYLKWRIVDGRGPDAQATLTAFGTDITNARRAVHAIEEDDARFRTIASTVPVLLYVTDSTGGLVFVSSRWEEFTGLVPSESRGYGWLASVHPDDAPEVRRRFESASLSAEPWSMDFRLRNAEGEFRWMSNAAEPSPDPAMPGFVGTMSDITARKRVVARLQETSERLHTVIASLPEVIVFKDERGRWQTANRSAEKLFDLGDVEWANRTDDQLSTLKPRARETFEALSYSDARAWKRGSRYDSVDILRDQTGLPIYFEAVRMPLYKPDGSPMGLVMLGRNAGERRFGQEALDLAASVFEQNSEALMIADAEKRILRVNRAFTSLTGYLPEEVMGHTPKILSSGRHGADFYAAMWQSIKLSESWHGEIWNRRKNGEIFPAWLTISVIRDAEGRIQRYIGSFSDIGEQKRVEEERRRLALFDALTALPNRVLIEERLRTYLEEVREAVALCLIDICQFEQVNLSFGFAAGDAVLCAVADRLKTTIGERGVVGRWAGDQFAIVIPMMQPDVDRQHVLGEVVEEILRLFDSRFFAGGHSVRLNAAIGVANSPDDGIETSRILRGAEAALNNAKKQGPGSYRFFTSQMEEAVRFRLALEEALFAALDRGEFSLVFQPILDLERGRVVRAEALLRWHHHTRGIVPPGTFIKAAEESGAILGIGRIALREACSTMRAWWDRGFPLERVAVNLSALQLTDVDFVGFIREILRENALSPQNLELEITESIFIREDAHQSIALLTELRSMGVFLTLDDFGTRFSSLSYLKRLPFHVLKIDQAFVRGLPDDPGDVALTRAILVLAKSLGLEVVAEGVESPQQAQFLSMHGCKFMQGYYLSPPVLAAELPSVVAMIEERSSSRGPGDLKSA
jgi:diguanylate cyclase (GGDEF)-like protein/PAS domain S-box-containing protein